MKEDNMELDEFKDATETTLEDVQKSLMTDVPGIGMDEVVEHYVDVEFKKDLDKCKTKEEKKKLRGKLIKHYKKSKPGKKFIEDNFNNLKVYFGQVKDGIKQLPDAIQSMIDSMTIPAVITTGSATSVHNPAWVIKDIRAKAAMVKGVLNQLYVAFGMLLGIMVLLHITPPKAITDAQKSVNQIMTLVNAIPV